MQPTYCDGDMLLVEMTDEIEIGEIGIFSVDGDCYVKKLGNGELISLNEQYNNIPLNETAKCMGRVIDKL
ncbi:MAG: S24 family peptidase [Alistipes sp.]|nr:S24 family peptidase [Alistipes sp.]